MTIQQLYDKALAEGALNFDIWLSNEEREKFLEENDFIFDHKYKCVDIK